MAAVKRMTRWLVLGGLAVAAVGALLVMTGTVPLPGQGTPRSEAAAPRPAARDAELPAVAVTVAAVTPRPIQRSVQIVGTFYGQEEVTITPVVEGRVAKIFHDVGDLVKPGDVLLEWWT